MPGDGGNGNGEGGKGNAGGDAQQQLNDALTKVGALEAETKTLKEASGDLERKLDDADKELLSEDYLNFKEGKGKKGAGDEGNGGNGGAAEDKNFDINNATNAELAAHIGKQSAGSLDKIAKELTSRIEKADDRVGLALAQVDISLTSMRHPDGGKEPGFTENFEAIKKVAKANPEWGSEKCYQQFKLEKLQSDKTTKDAADEKAKEDSKVLTEKGGGVPISATTGKALTKEEAAELAYQQAFGNAEKKE